MCSPKLKVLRRLLWRRGYSLPSKRRVDSSHGAMRHIAKTRRVHLIPAETKVE